MSKKLEKKYNHLNSEQTWKDFWEDEKIYSFDSSKKAKEGNFVVDTPPPTVSGSLHIGHVFSYSHTDIISRFQRMLGKNILYPMGWDDNGLPTERRVQNCFDIRCNPSLPYDPDWKPVPAKSKSKTVEVSRQNFIEACGVVTEEDEKVFEQLWRRLGLSVDWSQQYATIDKHCRKISQASFVELFEKGFIYQDESPTMWDVGFQTALAQADIEDRECPGAYHDIIFSVCSKDASPQSYSVEAEFTISTTRPELLAACIAVVAHPDDERYQKYFNQKAITPLFGAQVPILPSTHADPEKGTGIMMVCTFGDANDVEWWKSSSLPIKQIIDKRGKLKEIDFTQEPFLSVNPELAEKFYSEIAGLKNEAARAKTAELLEQVDSRVVTDGKALKGELKKITHPVKFYEKGTRPIEFITTRQWFTKILDYKSELLAQGDKINWHPSHMKTRYQHWVEGLNQDWCISRQRFFGVPFPVWYEIDSSGNVDYQKPILAKTEDLPIDPYVASPPNYTEEQRDQPGGFTHDPDVMDTWATSSLTPQLVSNWGIDSEKHKSVFPMDVRPQSHEIIRTWAFYTIAKAWMHEKEVPWKNIVISGWILDPDRKKMSKSKGNVVTPERLLDTYSTDAIRYWAARARLGVDTAFDESVLKIGQKLITKLFNASKFVLSFFDEDGQDLFKDPSLAKVTEPLDKSFLLELNDLVLSSSESLKKFDYAAALNAIEQSFWNFCDNYLELVKVRAYAKENVTKEEQESALITLKTALSVYLRLFAPYIPYITEEVWQASFSEQKNFFFDDESTTSIHKSKWPSEAELNFAGSAEVEAGLLELASSVIAEVRSVKSKAEKKLKWPVTKLEILTDGNIDSKIKAVEKDLSRAANLLEGSEFLINEGDSADANGLAKINVNLADTFEEPKNV